MKGFLVVVLILLILLFIEIVKDFLRSRGPKRCRVSVHHQQDKQGMTRWYCFSHREPFYAVFGETDPQCPESIKENIVVGGGHDLTRKKD